MASLFTSQTPSTTDASDGTPGITTATTLVFAVDGTVTGIRFFATATVSGTYTAALWQVTGDDAGTGTLLASKTMGVAPTAGTWNTVVFDTPVSVTAGVGYRAGIFSGAGRYVATTGFFSSGLTNGDISAPAHNGTAGAFTVYQGTFLINAAIGYPTSTSGSACYFVDVAFTASGTAFTRTVDDGVGLVDTTAVAAAHGRAITDSGGLVDTITRAFARALTDVTGLVDTTAIASAHARAQTDSTGLTDTTVVQLAIARTVNDTMGLADADTSQAFDVAETITDGLGLTDTVTPVLIPAGGTAYTRTVNDSAGLADTAAAAVAAARTVTDSAGLTDAVNAQLNTATEHVRTISDSMGLTSSHRCVRRTRRPYSGTTSRYPLVPD